MSTLNGRARPNTGWRKPERAFNSWASLVTYQRFILTVSYVLLNLSYITRIQPRRLTIIDEKLGLVFGFPMFVHLGNVQSIKIIGVPGVDTIPKNFPPFNLQAGEIFKIRGGQIHEIEANGTVVPYATSSGWDD